MKRGAIFSMAICLTLIFYSFAYAIDAKMKIEMKTSYKIFENCMKSKNNNITLCLIEFRNTVALYKKALKMEPKNKKYKKTLLELVNALNEIAETYTSAAEKKRQNILASEKYCNNAIICYDELIKLYPNNDSFKEKKVVLKNLLIEYKPKLTALKKAQIETERRDRIRREKKEKNKAKLNEKLRAEAKRKSLKVKELYLGMFLNDAIKIYEQKLNKPGDSYKVRKVGNEWWYGYATAVVFIKADSNKNVKQISLGQNAHFNAGDISTKDFVKLFSKRYKKSFSYKPIFNEGLTFDYYLHENPSYTISIGLGSVMLQRKASLKKVKFD